MNSDNVIIFGVGTMVLLTFVMAVLAGRDIRITEEYYENLLNETYQRESQLRALLKVEGELNWNQNKEIRLLNKTLQNCEYMQTNYESWYNQSNSEYKNLWTLYGELITEYNDQIWHDQCSLYDGLDYIDAEDRVIADGLYWVGTDYYCVWAEDRPLEEQEETDRHEYCHYLVDNEYEHFCEEKQ